MVFSRRRPSGALCSGVVDVAVDVLASASLWWPPVLLASWIVGRPLESVFWSVVLVCLRSFAVRCCVAVWRLLLCVVV